MALDFNFSDSDLYFEWEAWSASKKIRSVSVEHLNKFRTDTARKRPIVPRTSGTTPKKASGTGVQAFGATSRATLSSSAMEVEEVNDKSAVNQKKRARTLELDEVKPNSSFSGRQNKGGLAASFAGVDSAKFTGRSQIEAIIDIHPKYKIFEQPYRWNYNTDAEIQAELENRIQLLSTLQIERTHGDTKMSLPVENPSKQTIYTTVGMISSSDDYGPLHPREVLLAPLTRTSERLDLLGVPNASLFRGQVVSVEGVNPQGKRLIVQRLETNASADPRMLSDAEVALRSHELHIMVASGPFSMGDDMSYEPLNELLKQVEKRQPRILILCGPFVDIEHPSIVSGSLEQSFTTVYNNVMQKIEDTVLKLKYNISVIIVPSLKDATHQAVIPQPPLKRPEESSASFMFVPNPCILNINSLHFAIATPDILAHLHDNCLIYGTATKPEVSLSSFLLHQQSLYPLYPAPIPIDMRFASQALSLPNTPDAIILTSSLKPFVEPINSVLVINAGHVVNSVQTQIVGSASASGHATATTPGTFAEIKIAQTSATSATSLVQRAHVEVIKI